MNRLKLMSLLFVIVFYSCECRQIDLTDDDRSWNPYRKNEILIFKSSLNNVDTVRIANVDEDYSNKDCNWELASYSGNYLRTTLNFNICHDKYCDGEVLIEKKRNNTEFKFRVFGFENSGILEGIGAGKKMILKSKAVKQNHDSVYLFIDSKSPKHPSKYLRSFYWSKGYGLIKYSNFEGEEYELISRTN